MVFHRPKPETRRTAGHKVAARNLAASVGVSVIRQPIRFPMMRSK